jgi:hypothetical protein
LITSTLLSLVVVPAAFTIVDDARNWLMGRVRWRQAPVAEQTATAVVEHAPDPRV